MELSEDGVPEMKRHEMPMNGGYNIFQTHVPINKSKEVHAKSWITLAAVARSETGDLGLLWGGTSEILNAAGLKNGPWQIYNISWVVTYLQ